MATRKKTQEKSDIVTDIAATIAAPTLSRQIWDKINSIDLNLFALENQLVKEHADPVFDLSKEELFLRLKTDAALPQLEELVSKVSWEPGRSLEVEKKDKFVVVRVVQAS